MRHVQHVVTGVASVAGVGIVAAVVVVAAVAVVACRILFKLLL